MTTANEDDKTKAKQNAESEEIIDTSKMSEGKREALDLAEGSRDTTWRYPTFAGQLFMGQFPWEIIYPYRPQPEEDKKRGDDFLRKLEACLRQKTDPDQIDADGEIPEAVIKALAKMGAFGIKISTDYKGLGLSQTNYSRAAMLLGSHCGNVTALLSAHQSIGLPQPLIMFGTEEQKKKYLPRVAKGEISAFALTEDNVGSDPAKMETLAEPTEDGEHFIVNGKKIWCTNGTRAGLLVVMARTPDKEVRGKMKRQITAFIVEANTPGVTVDFRCRFMGLKSLYNAVISFKDVKVPRENIILGEGQGLKVALATLNTGRLTLPAACVGLAKNCLGVVRKWAGERVQWGAPIGKHGAIADKIATIAAQTFALESMTLLTAALVDKKETDIRIEASMSKMWGTETAWRIVDETMAIRGGRGYETAHSLKERGEEPVPVERFMRDCRINMIFEGSSEIMRLFIAREALDPHLRLGAAAMNSKLPMSARMKAAGKAAKFYAGWYLKQCWPGGTGAPTGMHRTLASHARYAARTSKKLARTLFHAMVRYGAKLEREQMVLGRLVEVGTELYAIAATCSRAQYLIEQGENKKEILTLVDFFCRESRLRIKQRLRGVSENNDRRGYRLARQVLDGDFTWLEEGIVGKEI